MEDPKDFEDVKRIQRNLFNTMAEGYLHEVHKIFEPFEFESIKPLMLELIGKVKAFVDVQSPEILKFLEIKTDQKFEIRDKKVLEFDYVEKHFAEDLEKENNTKIDNFLTQQRMLALLNDDEIEKMKEMEEMEVKIEYELTEMEPDPIYNIILIKKNPTFNLLYSFSDKWIRLYDENMNQKHIVENKFGDIRDVDFYNEYCAIGCYSGDIYVTKGEELDVTYKYNISL